MLSCFVNFCCCWSCRSLPISDLYLTSSLSCTVSEILGIGNGKISIPPPVAPKPLNRFRWNLEYVTTYGYDHTCKSTWRCDSMGGLGEHETCHMFFGFLVYLSFFFFMAALWNKAGHYIFLLSIFLIRYGDMARRRCIRYGDGAGNTVEENSSVFSLIRMRYLPSVLWCSWLGSRKGIRPVKTGDGEGGHWLVRMEWCPAGWSVCLPLLIFPCTIKSRSSFLVPADPGGLGFVSLGPFHCA